MYDENTDHCAYNEADSGRLRGKKKKGNSVGPKNFSCNYANQRHVNRPVCFSTISKPLKASKGPQAPEIDAGDAKGVMRRDVCARR